MNTFIMNTIILIILHGLHDIGNGPLGLPVIFQESFVPGEVAEGSQKKQQFSFLIYCVDDVDSVYLCPEYRVSIYVFFELMQFGIIDVIASQNIIDDGLPLGFLFKTTGYQHSFKRRAQLCVMIVAVLAKVSFYTARIFQCQQYCTV